MYRAGIVCSILSKLAQEDPLEGGGETWRCRRAAPARWRAKLKAHGLNGIALVITDSMDENLLLASRNLKNVHGGGAVDYADPVSMIHFDKVVVTRPAIAKLEHDRWGSGMRSDMQGPTGAKSLERLAKVLIAPVVSEKTTMIADKHNQVAFRVVQDATKPESASAAVELLFWRRLRACRS